MNTFDFVFMIAKCLLVIVFMLQVVPVMVWVERRGSALMQNRLGPNRVGPLGLFHALADVVKFVFKEDMVPGHVERFYYILAPLVALVPAFMTFAVVPFAGPIEFFGKKLIFQAADLNVGILYIFSIASLGVYGIMMAGWSSNNKYSLLGSIRATAQMISYELSMGLSLIGLIMTFSSIKLGDIVAQQAQTFIQLGPIAIPKYGIFIQPIGFIIFLTAVFAETNRLPFDLPEGESEIVAGFHLEYGAMKFALFFMAEYINMAVGAALISTLFFGGYHLMPGMNWILDLMQLSGVTYDWTKVLFQLASLTMKTAFFLWFFVWVRWTLPRFRFDQLMNLGWKVMFPLALANVVLTGALIYLGVL